MILKKMLIFLFLASQLHALQVLATEDQANKLQAGPVYLNNDDSYGVVIELPLTIEASNLSKDNVKLNISDHPIEAVDLKSFKKSGEKLAWLINVDVSGSMAGAPLREIKASLLSLLGDRRSLQIGLISFGNESKIEFGIENKDEDRLLTDAVRNLRDHGGSSKTKLYQTLYEALDYLEESSKTADIPLRRRILVVSDGKDEGSSISAQNVIDRSKGLGIPIDAVGRGRIEPQYIESLRLLAEGTGGYFVHAEPDRLSLSDALKRVYGMLMETQTAVAYFEYEADTTMLTDLVAVAVHLPTSKLSSASLNVKLPVPRSEAYPSPPPPPSSSSWWIWLVFGIVIILLVIASIVWRRTKVRNERKQNEGSINRGDYAPQRETVITDHEISPSVKDGGQSYTHEESASTIPSKVRHETVVGGAFAPPQHNKPSVLLVGVDGSVKNQKIGVDKEIFFIGASHDNDLSILDDQFVSSKHACIRYENGSFHILDQESSNGTFVNGERLGSSACLLIPGSRIKLGNSTFEIHRVSG